MACCFQTCEKYKLSTPQKEYRPLYVLNQVIQLGTKDQTIFQVHRLLNGNSLYFPDAAHLQTESHPSADVLFYIMAQRTEKVVCVFYMTATDVLLRNRTTLY